MAQVYVWMMGQHVMYRWANMLRMDEPTGMDGPTYV